MDTNNNGQAPATDDQELAQVLAGMNQQAATNPVADGGLQFEETGSVPAPADPVTDQPTVPEPETVPPLPTEPALDPQPVLAPEPLAAVPSFESPLSSNASPELESIKKDALEQLRPLVDKLNLPAQEKFDTLLLIIRSTDDQSLLTAANDAAKSIEDETKRAEALLDVIKEIDFFSHPQQ